MPVDPIAGGVPAADIAAIVAGELAALAADAQTLGARLSTGDVVQAIVLPSNGLTDLLDIGGLRVAAELPPTLLPGDTIAVAVTGFSGDRINLQIVSTPRITRVATPATESPDMPARMPALRRAAARPAGTTAIAPPTGGALRTANVPASGSAPPGAAAPAPGPVLVPSGQTTAAQAVPVALKTVEARLAAAHAMTVPSSRPPAGATTPPNRSGQSPAAALPAAPRPVIAVRPPLAVPSPLATVAVAAPRGLGAFSEPAAFLRALHLPVTAANVASARMALESPERLPNALATLERALANNTDPRVSTLSTLTSFLARLDPRSPVFATQIAAFVDHVITGGEAKIAQLLHLWDAALPAGEHTNVGAGGRGEPPAAQSANPPPSEGERVAVARAALDFDLKTQLLALAANGSTDVNAATPKTTAFNAALCAALTAITALQLNAASALDANPGGLAFMLPVALPGGVANAHVRIDPGAQNGKRTPFDGDNFHLAFVLETQHLGTVAIDVLTVGRAVTLSVMADAAPAQRVFGGALGQLTARLEKLRYRVAKADAIVAPPRSVNESPSRPAAVEDRAQRVDVDA